MFSLFAFRFLRHGLITHAHVILILKIPNIDTKFCICSTSYLVICCTIDSNTLMCGPQQSFCFVRA